MKFLISPSHEPYCPDFVWYDVGLKVDQNSQRKNYGKHFYGHMLVSTVER